MSETDIRWGVEQRLEFIEFRLFWEGGVNRSDITGYFGVSVPQASKDLSQYQGLAPENITYDKRRKRYLKTQAFSARFLKPDSDRYLSQLHSIADKTLAPTEAWVSEPPPLDVLRMPHRNVDPDILRTTLEAVRTRTALEIRYQSLSERRPGPIWRWISPHAFAFDGHRWHVRAFCHIDREFKDFLLPRFLKARATGPAEASPKDDAIWNEFVDVALKPHPKLNNDQKKVVEQDYGMKSERFSIPVRLALLYYFLRRLGLDFEEEKRSAREQHIVLANPDEIRAALKRAKTPNSTPTANAAA
jgi:predicted DNA-binding transcriptional regulator YafY